MTPPRLWRPKNAKRALADTVVGTMSSLLACFATTPDDDDSSVPMCPSPCYPEVNLYSPLLIPTFTPGATPTLSPTTTIYPTHTPIATWTPVTTYDPASYGPSIKSGPTDKKMGIRPLWVLAGVMGVALGAFGVVARRVNKHG